MVYTTMRMYRLARFVTFNQRRRLIEILWYCLCHASTILVYLLLAICGEKRRQLNFSLIVSDDTMDGVRRSAQDRGLRLGILLAGDLQGVMSYELYVALSKPNLP